MSNYDRRSTGKRMTYDRRIATNHNIETVYEKFGGYQWALVYSYSYEGSRPSHPPPPTEEDRREWEQRVRSAMSMLQRGLRDPVVGPVMDEYLKGYDHLQTMGMDSVDGVAIVRHNVTPEALLNSGWENQGSSLGRGLYKHLDSRWKVLYSRAEHFVGFMP
jgi:hypothetical protein